MAGNLYVTVEPTFSPEVNSKFEFFIAEKMEGKFNAVFITVSDSWMNPTNCATLTLNSTDSSYFIHCPKKPEQTADEYENPNKIVYLVITIVSSIILAAFAILLLILIIYKKFLQGRKFHRLQQDEDEDEMRVFSIEE